MNPTPTFAPLAALRARWATLQPREQTLVRLAALLVLAAQLWWLALAPALKTLRSAPAQHQQLDAQLQQMARLQAQARTLQAQPRLEPEAARRALEAAVKQGLGAGAQLHLAGERATVQLKGVPAEAIAPWLAQLRNNARAVPVQVKLTRSSAPPAGAKGAAATAGAVLWDGSVVLALPSH